MQKDVFAVAGQLRLGDSETTNFTPDRIEAKLQAARDLAGLDRLLFLPSLNPKLNARIREKCRELGIEVYLWYKVLADNEIIPGRCDLTENAWGRRGLGESGIWPPILDAEESYQFACSRNTKYNNLLLAKCEQLLGDYDGLLADYVGFPLPSMGLDAVYSCFCPYCLADEPRLAEWRMRVREARESFMSATDADMEKWETFADVGFHYGTEGYRDFRYRSVVELAAKYAGLAHSQGKKVGFDIVSPALALFSGQDYARLGAVADWLKPRLYSRVYGPSSLPLEFSCLAVGLSTWGRRFTLSAVLRFIERATGIRMPPNAIARDASVIPTEFLRAEAEKARKASPCPVYPAIEFALHPEHQTSLDADGVRQGLEAAAGSSGLVLAWNLLYIPDEYLRIIGKRAE